LTIWIAEDARRQIAREASRRRVRETGGPLFGYAEGEDVVLVGAGGPGPNARHRPWSFQPDHEGVDRAIQRIAQASGGTFRYQGSWHTHPLGRPIPSSTDLAAVDAIRADAEVALARPVLIILRVWPLRRTISDRDMRAYRWSETDAVLASEDFCSIRHHELPYEPVAIDWGEVVR
jgi:integrative and conjugative element protein (TIGR02256 family)